MKFSKLSLSLICCAEYKKDSVIKCFVDIFSDDCTVAIDGYMELCRILFTENKTLSDYIFFLATNGNNPILNNYLVSRDISLYNVIKNDISVLSLLSATTPEEIIDDIKSRFSIDKDVSFVKYNVGDTVVNAETIIAFAERFGSAVFADNKAFVLEEGAL